MKTMLWNWISGLGLHRKTRNTLFLATITLFYALIGYVLWLLLGTRLLSDRVEWMLCFIGFFAFFPGFLTGIIYLYKYE